MNIYVYTDHINITSRDNVNKNEFNAHQCAFQFDSGYEGLIKKALFKDSKGDLYEMLINNNKCHIPSEVLKETGIVQIGVYAFKAENGVLKLRFSPHPAKFNVIEGSYEEGAQNTSDPTSTELEQLESAIGNIENIINNMLESITDTQEDITDIQESITNINNAISQAVNDIGYIQQEMQNLVTVTDVQTMIDTAYTNVMEVEY